MSSTVHDPRLLFSVNNISAFHIQNGEETELTPSGPQTLSLLMVPTTASAPQSYQETPAEEDFYLHLHLPPELDMALPATTQIYHQPSSSYLIPRWDLGPDAGAFIRIQFPPIGTGPNKVTQEDIDTFETILAQCTAFLERASVPQDHTAYNPANFAPGEGYVSSPAADKKGQNITHDPHGRIVLIDEENGSVVGEMEGYDVVERPGVKPGSKRPVEIQLPEEGEGNRVSVANVSEEYLETSRHPAYQKSTLVQTSATASRLIVTGSSYLARAMTSGADNFTKKTKPNPKPMTFSENTHARVRKVGTFSTGAADISARTVGQVNRYAQNIGASFSGRRKDEGKTRSPDSGNRKPGILNKSMIAFSTLADGIEQGARNVLTSGSTAASAMVGHRYGAEAGAVATDLTGGVKNVGLVYIDASGVSRKAILKSVAKGMVVGRMKDGKQVVVGNGHGTPSPPGGPSTNPAVGFRGDPVMRRPSPNPTPPPAYGAQDTTLLSETPMSMSGGKR
ncbi:hypothetical protein FE257_001352 [Aspergillus nanangensis]|uniref:Senescence domain-containing protein n=1 Tax=Aspergillus nanangensis TaxID=2582783 RepID=A0AAD4CDU4_ASPNN|nr:hypothetical protein FE257_001352 [Aspergillus nanangensis]